MANLVGIAAFCVSPLIAVPDVRAQTAQTAQGTPIPPLTPQDRRLDPPEFPSPVRPRLELQPAPTPGTALPAIPSPPTIVVRRFAFEGSAVFSEAELQAIAAPYLDRPIASEDLEELRPRLTRLYIDAGYVSSGAVLPDQEVRDGVVVFGIIEGAAPEITVSGGGDLRPSYVRNRLALGATAPFNIHALEERFQMLLQDPLIDRLDGRFGAGTRLGESKLDVAVAPSPKFDGSISLDNHRPKSVGEIQGRMALAINNITGFGDVWTIETGRSDGAFEVATGYSIPVTAHDTRLFMSAETSTSTVLEEPLDGLDIDSQSWGLDIGLRHPVFRGLGWEAGVSATLSRRHSKTSVLGVPFTFAAGANEGVTDVAVFRFGQDLLVRDARRVIALRSTVNVGTNLFHATRNEGDLPDGQFVSWLGQAQMVHKLFDTETSLVARLDVQRTSRRLLPLEQFSIGGANSVRGYRENQFIRDEGVTASIEARIPLFDLGLPGLEAETEPGPLSLAIFADTGWAWTKGATLSRYEDLHSVGFGFRWDPTPWVHGEIYAATALKSLENETNRGLQDHGVHFRITVGLP